MAFWGKKKAADTPPAQATPAPPAPPAPDQVAPPPAPQSPITQPAPQAVPAATPMPSPAPAQTPPPSPAAQPPAQPAVAAPIPQTAQTAQTAPPAVPAAQPPAGTAPIPAQVPPQQADLPADGESTPQGQRRHASLNSQLAPSLGKMVSVLMFSHRHASMTLLQAAGMLLPALTANQFVVAEAHPQGKDITAPVGLLLWARISSELDQKFSSDPNSQTQLKGDEWCCGEHLWIIEAVGPGNVVEAMVKQLADGPFKDKQFKYRNREADGSFSIKVNEPTA